MDECQLIRAGGEGAERVLDGEPEAVVLGIEQMFVEFLGQCLLRWSSESWRPR